MKKFFGSILFTLFFFLSSSSVSAITLDYVDTVLSGATDVAISGNSVYVAHGISGSVVDISDPQSPIVGDTITAPLIPPYTDLCYFYSVAADEGNAYFHQTYSTCVTPNGLVIYDISDPDELEFVEKIDLNISPGPQTQMEIYEDHIYLVHGANGLFVIDISDPDNPSIVEEFFATNIRFEDIKIVDDKAYVTKNVISGGPGGIWVLDISTPTNITLIDGYDYQNNLGAYTIEVKENYAYASIGDNFAVLDISDPENITETDIDNLNNQYTGAGVNDIVAVGGYAFVADTISGVIVLDVSDPEDINIVESWDTTGNYANKLAIKDNYVYVADGNLGLQILSGPFLLDVPVMKQTDEDWDDLEYDHGNSQTLICGSTIEDCGCVVTSAAMMLRYHGVYWDENGDLTTPETLNDYLNQGTSCGMGGCTSDGYSFGSVIWSAISAYSEDANAMYGTQKIVGNGSGSYNENTVRSDIENGDPVILKVSSSPEHWALGVGTTNDTVLINDPYYDHLSLDNGSYNDTAITMQRYTKTSSDFSNIEITSLAPTQVMITDFDGRKAGYSETTGIIEEIPESTYFYQPAQENPGAPGGNSDSGVYKLIIPTPEKGSYSLQVTSREDKYYSFSVHAFDRDANNTHRLYEENLEAEEEYSYTFLYSPVPEESTLVLKAAIDIKPLTPNNIVYRNVNTLIPVAIYSTNTFDAQNINISTVKFGKTGSEDSLSLCLPLHLNGDGKRDMACFFKSWMTGFQLGDTVGVLKANTEDEQTIEGIDTVIIR